MLLLQLVERVIFFPGKTTECFGGLRRHSRMTLLDGSLRSPSATMEGWDGQGLGEWELMLRLVARESHRCFQILS